MEKKKIKGMRHLKSGTYEIEIRDVRLPTGRLCISSRTKDGREAKRRLRAIRNALDQGELELIEAMRSGRIHLSDFANAIIGGEADELRTRIVETQAPTSIQDAYEAVVEAARLTRAPRTVQAHESLAAAMRQELDMQRPLWQFSPREAERFLTGPKENNGGKPWAPRSQANNRTLLTKIWRRAIRSEASHARMEGRRPRYVSVDNPWEEIELADNAKTEPAILTYEQWLELSRRNEGRPQHALLAACCLAGLRQQEAAHLRTALDINWEENEILIRVHGPNDEGGEWEEWKPKNNNSVRRVPMIPELRTVLRRHIDRGHAGERYLIRGAESDSPLSMTTCRKWAKDSFRRGRLHYGTDQGQYTLHSLRHSVASWMLREGAPVNVVAEFLGNTAKVVLDFYSHLFIHDKRAAAARVSAQLAARGTGTPAGATKTPGPGATGGIR